MNKIDLQPLLNLKNLLENSLVKLEKEKLDELGKMGVIQAFEVSYELAKNTLRKVLLIRAQEAPISPKEIFRLAGLEGLISNAEIWFEFAQKRNKTSHTYDGAIAQEILSSLPNFLTQLDLLIAKLKTIPECYS